jgi:molybdopterin converting factor small subunit
MNNLDNKKEISITIKFFADLRKYGPKKDDINLPEGSSIQKILEKYKIPTTNRNIIILVNGTPHKTRNYIIKEGDVIAIFPPIAGG